mgnify:CR=1 FL=1
MTTRYISAAFIILVVISLLSCAGKLDVPDKYIISETALRDSLSKNNNTVVLFFTEWCSASQDRLKNTYRPLNDSIKKNNLDLDIILLASDENVSLEQVEEYRKLGISTFYIQKPGANTIMNRMAIKSFINEAFPENEIERITKFQYGIPVELLFNKELEIVNEKDYNKSYELISSILK